MDNILDVLDRVPDRVHEYINDTKKSGLLNINPKNFVSKEYIYDLKKVLQGKNEINGKTKTQESGVSVKQEEQIPSQQLQQQNITYNQWNQQQNITHNEWNQQPNITYNEWNQQQNTNNNVWTQQQDAYAEINLQQSVTSNDLNGNQHQSQVLESEVNNSQNYTTTCTFNDDWNYYLSKNEAQQRAASSNGSNAVNNQEQARLDKDFEEIWNHYFPDNHYQKLHNTFEAAYNTQNGSSNQVNFNDNQQQQNMNDYHLPNNRNQQRFEENSFSYLNQQQDVSNETNGKEYESLFRKDTQKHIANNQPQIVMDLESQSLTCDNQYLGPLSVQNSSVNGINNVIQDQSISKEQQELYVSKMSDESSMNNGIKRILTCEGKLIYSDVQKDIANNQQQSVMDLDSQPLTADNQYLAPLGMHNSRVNGSKNAIQEQPTSTKQQDSDVSKTLDQTSINNGIKRTLTCDGKLLISYNTNDIGQENVPINVIVEHVPVLETSQENPRAQENLPNVNVKQPFTCKLCKRSFSAKGYLTQHLACKHSNIKIRCKIFGCPKVLHSDPAYIRHLAYHDGEYTLHQCSMCEKKYRYEYDLERHFFKHHDTKQMKTCSICGKGFARADHLRKHTLTHQRIKSGAVKRQRQQKPQNTVTVM